MSHGDHQQSFIAGQHKQSNGKNRFDSGANLDKIQVCSGGEGGAAPCHEGFNKTMRLLCYRGEEGDFHMVLASSTDVIR